MPETFGIDRAADVYEKDVTRTVVSAAEFFSERDEFIESLWGDGLLIPGGGYLIVGGEGGVGKTIVLAGLFLSLAAGLSSFLGFDLPGEETPVLILEGEGSRPKFRERILQIGDSYGINVAKLPVFFHKRDAVLSIEALGPMLAASEARAALLDPIGRFHDADENSNTEWRRAVSKPLASFSNEFGCAFALSDHYVKPDEMRQNRHKLRGAGAKFDDCGAAMRVEYGKGGKAARVLFVDRVRDGALPDPDRLTLSIGVGPGFVELDPEGNTEAVPGVADVADEEKIAAEVVRIIASVAKTPGINSEALQQGNKSVHLAARRRAVKDGKIEGRKDGKETRWWIVG